MSVTTFLVVFAAVAGAIALWIQVRFPDFGPDGLQRTIIHVGISLVLAQLVIPGLIKLAPPAGAAALLTLLFLIAFPALVYCFLSSIWVIKATQSAFHR